MGRKRGRIYEEIRRYMALYRDSSFLVIIDREARSGETIIPLKRIEKVTKTFIFLDNGTQIPLHRVIRVVRKV